MWKVNKKKCLVKPVVSEEFLDEIILTYPTGKEYMLSMGDIPPEEYSRLPEGKVVSKAYYVYLYRNDPDLYMDDKVIFNGDEYLVSGDMEKYHLMRRVVITWLQRSQ